MFNRTETYIEKYKSTVVKEMIEDNLNIYLEGTLESTGSACAHHHGDDHDHGHNCK